MADDSFEHDLEGLENAIFEQLTLDASVADVVGDNIVNEESSKEISKLRATLRAKDFEIMVLKRQLELDPTGVGRSGISHEELFDFDNSKSEVAVSRFMLVQERIEEIQRQEILALKKVIQIQKAIILRNQGTFVANNTKILNNHEHRVELSTTEGETSFLFEKGRSDIGDACVQSKIRVHPKSRSKARCPGYETPTISSILHSSPKRTSTKDRNSTRNALKREAMRILQELSSES